ncbi:hypothetical protein EB796_013675 [Bugula neritina]|uniref:Uncharacterized protein n=1 Tax=Bugula neritina TaxID=10212 RepID=A0A7J7JRG7_BUGNE|nr:hypothetical protein EB796_013675 [Bugula neritina]
MSAAYQEKIRQEERKRKAAEADKLQKELLKKSKPQPKPSASATPTPASALKSSPATRKLQQSPSNSRSASAATSAATSAAASSSKAKKLPTSPVLPLRQMRRPSPSRVIRKLETESPSASSTSKSSIKQDTEVEPMDTSEEPSAATSRLESSPQSSSKLSTSAVKVETTTPVPSKAAPKDVPVEKPKNYRIVGMRDITRGGLVVGAKVQGRYQSKWQDAEILEIRPDNVLVKFGNKISLAMKVKNPDKNVEGELRVEAEEDDEGGEVSQPSSTTTDEAEATPSTGYTATHHKKLVDLVKSLDESLDTDSLSLSNLADLDVAALLAQYTVKKQKEAVATSQEETSKQINQLRTELDAKTKETKMIKEEFTRREEERFEKIRDLFSRVLSVCIGAGPESRFTTYEELVDLLENIAESLAE